MATNKFSIGRVLRSAGVPFAVQGGDLVGFSGGCFGVALEPAESGEPFEAAIEEAWVVSKVAGPDQWWDPGQQVFNNQIAGPGPYSVQKTPPTGGGRIVGIAMTSVATGDTVAAVKLTHPSVAT